MNDAFILNLRLGLVESKGLDFVDREKAKHHAEKQAEELYRYFKMR